MGGEALRKALANGEVTTHFTPRVDLATGGVSSAEAAGVWPHPDGAPIAGSALVDAVAREGLALAFVERLVDESCALVDRVVRAGLDATAPFRVAVSVTLLPLADASLADRLTEMVQSHGQDPRRFVCEIDDVALAKAPAAALSVLTRLRVKGFRLAMRHSGSGPSWTHQLARVPLSELKVDRRLVSAAAGDTKRVAVLEAATASAREAGLDVVADGCDSQADFDTVLALGCSEAQGRFIAEPMPAAEWWRGPATATDRTRRQGRVDPGRGRRRTPGHAQFSLHPAPAGRPPGHPRKMVRLYVSTGEPRDRQHYDEILAIRSGTAPRPVNDDSSFWERVLAGGKGSVRYGPPESLVDQMRAAGFTEDEFEALNASLRASDGLAKLELEVMDRVAARIARGVDATYLSDVAPEYRRLVDADYLAQKGVIMAAIDDFVARVEARTLRAVEDARSTSRALSVVQMLVLGLIVLLAVAAMRRARRVVLNPLAVLAGATQRFATGDYRQRVDCAGVSELEELAGAFNSMAAAVQSDVERREKAERGALEARIAAEEANRAKSTFVAAMSHEIRTPMIGVTGMLEVLAQTPLDEEQRSMVATAQGSAQVLLQIIGDSWISRRSKPGSWSWRRRRSWCGRWSRPQPDVLPHGLGQRVSG